MKYNLTIGGIKPKDVYGGTYILLSVWGLKHD
jgi:hypothetical protein